MYHGESYGKLKQKRLRCESTTQFIFFRMTKKNGKKSLHKVLPLINFHEVKTGEFLEM